MPLPVYRAVIHRWMTARFEYVDAWFSNANLKREIRRPGAVRIGRLRAGGAGRRPGKSRGICRARSADYLNFTAVP